MKVETQKIGNDVPAVGKTRQIPNVRSLQRSFHGASPSGRIQVSQRLVQQFELREIGGSGRRSFHAEPRDAVSVIHLGARAILPHPRFESIRHTLTTITTQFRWKNNRA